MSKANKTAAPAAAETALSTADFTSSLTATQKAAYDVFQNEWGRQPMTPEIKISYDEETKSLFIMKNGKETKVIGPTVNGVIIKVRSQYSLWNDDKDQSLKTNEFDNFNENITLTKGNNHVLTGSFAEVKAYIKLNHPTMKFINIVYFFYEGNIYKVYVKPASRKNLWDYQTLTAAKAPFSFVTELSTEKGTKGSTVYWAMKFRKVSDMTPEEFKKHFELRIELDKTLVQIEKGFSAPMKESEEEMSVEEIFNQ